MDGMAIVETSPPMLMIVESGRVNGLWNLIRRRKGREHKLVNEYLHHDMTNIHRNSPPPPNSPPRLQIAPFSTTNHPSFNIKRTFSK